MGQFDNESFEAGWLCGALRIRGPSQYWTQRILNVKDDNVLILILNFICGLRRCWDVVQQVGQPQHHSSRLGRSPRELSSCHLQSNIQRGLTTLRQNIINQSIKINILLVSQDFKCVTSGQHEYRQKVIGIVLVSIVKKYLFIFPTRIMNVSYLNNL